MMAARIADGAEIYLEALAAGLRLTRRYGWTTGQRPSAGSPGAPRPSMAAIVWSAPLTRARSFGACPPRTPPAAWSPRSPPTVQDPGRADGNRRLDAPGTRPNILALEPTDRVAKRLSSRIDKTILLRPRADDLVAKPRSRDSSNTVDTKELDGGTLYITTAGSASQPRRGPCPICLRGRDRPMGPERRRGGEPP